MIIPFIFNILYSTFKSIDLYLDLSSLTFYIVYRTVSRFRLMGSMYICRSTYIASNSLVSTFTIANNK